MDIRKIKKLIELLEESGIAEIEIHEGEESVRISRNAPNTGPVIMQQPAMMPAAAPAPTAAAPVETPVDEAESGSASSRERV